MAMKAQLLPTADDNMGFRKLFSGILTQHTSLLLQYFNQRNNMTNLLIITLFTCPYHQNYITIKLNNMLAKFWLRLWSITQVIRLALYMCRAAGLGALKVPSHSVQCWAALLPAVLALSRNVSTAALCQRIFFKFLEPTYSLWHRIPICRGV